MLFKKFLTDPEIARDFLDIHLPPHIKERCDLSSLRLENTSFIEENLKQHYADVLYSVNISGKKAYVYVLIEAQSTPEKLMPFRILRYQVSIMKRHLERGYKTLPIVVPLLFYSGQTQPYPYSVELMDCFDDPKLAREVMFKELKLIDLSVIPEEEIKTHRHIALLEGVMKHIYTRDALNLACYIMDIIHCSASIHRHLDAVVKYVIIAKRVEKAKDFIDMLIEHSGSGEYKEQLMHYHDDLRQEGFEKGMLQGTQKGREEGQHEKALGIAKNLLSKGFEVSFIEEVTHLPKQEILKLSQSRS